MLRRIRPGRVAELYRRDLPAPVDVLNLITPSRFAAYRWYGLFVMPALLAVGGRVKWMARHERSLHGEPQAEKLLIVRYPSHRRFLAMTLNPYYLVINRFREAGVERFEASFTHATRQGEGLARRRLLIGVHFNSPPGEDALPAVEDILGPLAGELVYATRAVASLGFLDPLVATDPHPLALGELALFAPAEGEPFEAAAVEAAARRLAAVTDALSLQLYRREPRSAYRPAIRGVPRPAGAAAG